jgi:hypothetical protein
MGRNKSTGKTIGLLSFGYFLSCGSLTRPVEVFTRPAPQDGLKPPQDDQQVAQDGFSLPQDDEKYPQDSFPLRRTGKNTRRACRDKHLRFQKPTKIKLLNRSENPEKYGIFGDIY